MDYNNDIKTTSSTRLYYIVSVVLGAFILMSSGVIFAAPKKLQKPKTPLISLASESPFSATLTQDKTVIQFWASWCTGCGVVMAEMSTLLSKHPEVGYVTVSLDENIDLAQKYFANKSDEVKQVLKNSFLDPSGSTFAEPLGIESLPFMLIVRKDGTILKRISGHPTKADLEFLLRKV